MKCKVLVVACLKLYYCVGGMGIKKPRYWRIGAKVFAIVGATALRKTMSKLTC
jgi:hypothetical protein